jgi:hypothetical protein
MKAGKEKQVYGGDNSRRKKISRWKKGKKGVRQQTKMIQINGGKLNIGKNL